MKKKLFAILGLIAFGSLCLTGNALAVYGNVAIVATSGGNYTDPVAAMNDIATWCIEEASPIKSCLIKIMPGTYDLNHAYISVPYWDGYNGFQYGHIAIEGSGEFSTKIINGGIGGTNPDLEAHLSISNLSIEKIGVGVGTGIAIYLTGFYGSVDVSNVTINATDVGVTTKSKKLSLDNVNINMTGESTIFGQAAVGHGMNFPSRSGSVFLNNVDINIDSDEFGPVEGVVITGYSYLTMRNSSIKIEADTGSREAWGIRLATYLPSGVTDVIEANISNVDISVNNISAEAAAIAFLTWKESNVAKIDNVRATATSSSGTASAVNLPTAIVSGIGNSLEINHSILSGEDYSIFKGSDPTTLSVGLSQLIGPISAPAATLNCFGNYDGAYTAVSCP